MKAIRVASVQYEHAEGDKRANLAKVEGFVQEAREQSVALICFPEACLTGYWFLCNAARPAFDKLAEPVPDGPSTRSLMDLAKANDMTIGAGLIERADDGTLYNTYVVAMPDGQVRRHRKLHCFLSKALGSGSEYTVFDTPHGCRVGVLTCYDNNLVENVRLTALQGAEILLAPHQTGGCRSRNPHIMGLIDRALWDNRRKDPEAIEAEFKGPKGRGWLLRWLPARAHDNGLFLVFSNGVGVDGDEIRTGNAMIIDPHGRVLAETWKADDDMVVADLDPALQKDNLGQRFLRARRPDLYEPLARSTGIEQDIHTVRFSEG
jgi:predicted amidohydrolase